jgi:hypothetical protein
MAGGVIATDTLVNPQDTFAGLACMHRGKGLKRGRIAYNAYKG